MGRVNRDGLSLLKTRSVKTKDRLSILPSRNSCARMNQLGLTRTWKTYLIKQAATVAVISAVLGAENVAGSVRQLVPGIEAVNGQDDR